MIITEQLKKRFFEGFDKSGDPNSCWPWIKGRDHYGYGQISSKKIKIKTHRLSWIINNGPIPEGLYVCHSCDNPPCVNPKHLWLGTHKDNMGDLVTKGLTKKGVKHWNHKLTESDIRDICKHIEAGESQRYISKIFGVANQSISKIVTGKRWNGITGYKPIFGRAKGERNGTSKLNANQVIEIFKYLNMGESQYKIADRFNVSQALIGHIKNRKIWSHVTDPLEA